MTAGVTSEWLWCHTCWTQRSLESSVVNQMNTAWNDPVLNSVLTVLSSNSVPGRRIWIGNFQLKVESWIVPIKSINSTFNWQDSTTLFGNVLPGTDLLDSTVRMEFSTGSFYAEFIRFTIEISSWMYSSTSMTSLH